MQVDTKSMTDPEDKYDYEMGSVAETGIKWIWIMFCSLLWIGAVASLFVRTPMESLVSFVIASAVSGAFYFVHIREHGHV